MKNVFLYKILSVCLHVPKQNRILACTAQITISFENFTPNNAYQSLQEVLEIVENEHFSAQLLYLSFELYR